MPPIHNCTTLADPSTAIVTHSHLECTWPSSTEVRRLFRSFPNGQSFGPWDIYLSTASAEHPAARPAAPPAALPATVQVEGVGGSQAADWTCNNCQVAQSTGATILSRLGWDRGGCYKAMFSTAATRRRWYLLRGGAATAATPLARRRPCEVRAVVRPPAGGARPRARHRRGRGRGVARGRAGPDAALPNEMHLGHAQLAAYARPAI
jgi:hypothetical protein